MRNSRGIQTKMYIIREMHVRVLALAVAASLVLAAGCGGIFGHEYEYEEQLYLSVDGSASIVIDSSVPALVALRGVPIHSAPGAGFDPQEVRRLYEAAGCHVVSVGQPWFRHGRRFIQVQVATPDVRTLAACAPLAWSTYRLDRLANEVEYRQQVGGAAGGNPGPVNWTGGELVAFKLHLPSKITFHNVRRLLDNAPGEPGRGNILTWEQRLTDRRAGVPIDMHVKMEPQSILYRTLWLFGGSFLAAVVVLAALIWWTVRKGRRRVARARSMGQ